MELIETPITCDYCNEKLDGYIWYCKKCELFLCFNCISKHVNHDIVPLKVVKPKKSKLLRISQYGAGPTEYEWTTFQKEDFLEGLRKCEHALNFLDSKKVIFHCEDCRELLCPECLKKHEEHNIMPYVSINNENLRMIYYYSYPGSNVKITTSGPKNAYKGEKISVEMKIENLSIHPLKDIKISLLSVSEKPGANINSMGRMFYIESHYPNYVLLDLEKEISIIKKHESKVIKFDFRIPKDEDTPLSIPDDFIIYSWIDYENNLNLRDSVYSNDLSIKLINKCA